MADRSIVDVGKFLQKYWNVGENPNIGTGSVGGHAPGSYHYAGQAIDVTVPQGQDVAPAYEGGKPIPWKQRTGELSWRAKQLGLFNEALGPGDKGHDTHVHLALPGKKSISDQQLEWLATGRTKDLEGKLTDVMPGAMQPQQVQQGQQVVQQPKGNTYIVVPDSSIKEGGSQDFLASYLQNMMQPTQLKSNINPTAMLMAAVNQTPNYFES
jgi:hypothetical protein